ncbi:MAG: pentapeptide repeat-containing protein [Paracoccaceae bacterium]
MTELQIPLAPEVFWPMVFATTLLIVVALAYSQMSEHAPKTPWLTKLQDSLGLEKIERGLFAASLLLYLFIFLSLFFGLATLIWQTIAWSLESLVQTKKDGELGLSQHFLFYVLRIAGLTTVLAAVVAFPVTLHRLRLTSNQNKTAEDALFNEKVNAAMGMLYARRQADDGELWEDDIVKRMAGIERLKRLASEQGSFALEALDILSSYIRQISVEKPAKDPPIFEGSEPPSEWYDSLKVWAQKLPLGRTDILIGLKTIVEIQASVSDVEKDKMIDLTHCNFQQLDLEGISFAGLDLSFASFQGGFLNDFSFSNAKLDLARFEGTKLYKVDFTSSEPNIGLKFEGATLENCNFSHSIFRAPSLHGTRIHTCDLKGSAFSDAEVDQNTVIHSSDSTGSAWFPLPEFENFNHIAERYPIFARRHHDKDIKLHKNTKFDNHTPDKGIGGAWRAWQRSIKFNPNNPDKP